MVLPLRGTTPLKGVSADCVRRIEATIRFHDGIEINVSSLEIPLALHIKENSYNNYNIITRYCFKGVIVDGRLQGKCFPLSTILSFTVTIQSSALKVTTVPLVHLQVLLFVTQLLS